MLNARISHVSLGVADVDSTSRFYEDHLGLRAFETVSTNVVRLGIGSQQHVLELSPGSGLDHFALEVGSESAVERIAQCLADLSIEAEWAEPAGLHPPALSFSDPDGHRVELHLRQSPGADAVAAGRRRPVGLHHITLSTPHVSSLVEFYVSVLGFAVSDRMGDSFMWLRCNREHHTVAIVEGPAAGLDHYCFEVEDWAQLKAWCDDLAAGDVSLSWGPGRHGPGNNLFVMLDDPDGVHIELSCEMERFWDDRVVYADPRNWAAEARTVNLWGPTPAWRRVSPEAVTV
jgi:catechol 2,3-dioxygenase